MRRLSDKILVAFYHACDHADTEVAMQLLSVREFRTIRPASSNATPSQTRAMVEASGTFRSSQRRRIALEDKGLQLARLTPVEAIVINF